MKHRNLIAAAALALAAGAPGALVVGGGPVSLSTPSVSSGSQQLPTGGPASGGDIVTQRRTGKGGRFKPHAYRKQPGPGHLAAGRLKVKRRNKLRAKGRHRAAVR